MQNPERTQFGEESVTPEEKTSRVRSVFDSVAEKYDLMNDLMSGGLHRLWKDRLVRQIRPRNTHKILDVAGGTGDIAFRMQRKAPGADITICDLNEDMLNVGRDRAIDKGWLNTFEWITGNAESLPFPNSHFDIYTIAFGLRNVTHIDTALKEAYRILKPGGIFYCLEFSQVDNPGFAKLYDFHSFKLIPHIGKLITGDKDSYQYLVESIRKFPKASALCERLKEAGFTQASHTKLSGGIVAIHKAIKI